MCCNWDGFIRSCIWLSWYPFTCLLSGFSTSYPTHKDEPNTAGQWRTADTATSRRCSGAKHDDGGNHRRGMRWQRQSVVSRGSGKPCDYHHHQWTVSGLMSQWDDDCAVIAAVAGDDHHSLDTHSCRQYNSQYKSGHPVQHANKIPGQRCRRTSGHCFPIDEFRLPSRICEEWEIYRL